VQLDFLFDMTEAGKYPQADPVHLLRLFDFSEDELDRFATAINERLVTARNSLQVDKLHFIDAQNCSLLFELSSNDEGINLPEDQKTFVCRLSRSTFVNMLDIISRLGDGFNWLYDPSWDKVDLLLSPDGSW
jgi:hypothetical protein